MTDIETQTAEMVSATQSITIYTNDQYEDAARRILELMELVKEIKATFDPVVASANKAHKEALAARNMHLKRAEGAIAALKGLMAAYHDSLRALAEEDAANGADVVSAPPPVVSGVSTRTTWSAKVVDQEAAIKFIAENYAKWGKLVKLDPVALNKLARSLNEGLSAVLPGVEAVCKRGMAVKS